MAATGKGVKTMAKHDTCGYHQRNPEKGRCEHCDRMKIERKIVLMCAKSLIQAGYNIAVNDGEETTLLSTNNIKAIEEALFTTYEDYFLTSKQGFRDSFVRFIYGNDGPDVINDYGTSLEHIMSKVNDFADRQ